MKQHLKVRELLGVLSPAIVGGAVWLLTDNYWIGRLALWYLCILVAVLVISVLVFAIEAVFDLPRPWTRR